jgi:hypothetical protein
MVGRRSVAPERTARRRETARRRRRRRRLGARRARGTRASTRSIGDRGSAHGLFDGAQRPPVRDRGVDQARARRRGNRREALRPPSRPRNARAMASTPRDGRSRGTPTTGTRAAARASSASAALCARRAATPRWAGSGRRRPPQGSSVRPTKRSRSELAAPPSGRSTTHTLPRLMNQRGTVAICDDEQW